MKTKEMVNNEKHKMGWIRSSTQFSQKESMKKPSMLTVDNTLTWRSLIIQRRGWTFIFFVYSSHSLTAIRKHEPVLPLNLRNTTLICQDTLSLPILHYTTLHYTALQYTTLHCTTLHCTTLTTLYYSLLSSPLLSFPLLSSPSRHCPLRHDTALSTQETNPSTF